MALKLRRAHGELATGLVRLIIDFCAVQIRHAGGIDVQHESIALQRPFGPLQVRWFAELQATVRLRRARLHSLHAHTQIIDTLLLDEAAEMTLRGFRKSEHDGYVGTK